MHGYQLASQSNSAWHVDGLLPLIDSRWVLLHRYALVVGCSCHTSILTVPMALSCSARSVTGDFTRLAAKAMELHPVGADVEAPAGTIKVADAVVEATGFVHAPDEQASCRVYLVCCMLASSPGLAIEQQMRSGKA